VKVTVIGSGNMGSGFVKQFTKAGHEVRVVGRNAAQAAEVAARFGARAVAPRDAAAGADVVVLAVPYAEAVNALRSIGPRDGQIVVDASNPLTPDYMGLTIGHISSAAEEIARAVPSARVVKAFNTVFAQVLAEAAEFGNGRKVQVFAAGDDAKAREIVAGLASSIGFEPVDAGALKNARYLEPLAGLNIYLGYGASQGTGIAPIWIRKA